ncbi:uncharacterized protein BCR38DRAFT_129808 [Pseudomassariella vexata]|uniref:Uncharacterized protein n=1 Tax=Pseudomassariella vexata TaxID=1141098 RepID=A0A1Y2E9R0_9PEZI|nr:uncharacterized protein BCR38DRAFT_129808 [Pseudomassariella vexata]ORY68289.1 hypothetical protein BCR38DRAFT_129808 [Pseudomassariella vexata]
MPNESMRSCKYICLFNEARCYSMKMLRRWTTRFNRASFTISRIEFQASKLSPCSWGTNRNEQGSMAISEEVSLPKKAGAIDQFWACDHAIDDNHSNFSTLEKVEETRVMRSSSTGRPKTLEILSYRNFVDFNLQLSLTNHITLITQGTQTFTTIGSLEVPILLVTSR